MALGGEGDFTGKLRLPLPEDWHLRKAAWCTLCIVCLLKVVLNN